MREEWAIIKILIVDDERLICEWLEFCIQQNSNYELVGCAHNGEQALKIYYQTQPDVVLTDIKMPVMNGIELLKEIKTIHKDTVVVLLTAFSEFELARQAMREGADEYILKTEISNTVLQELLTRIEKNISQRDVNEKQNARNRGQKQSIVRNLMIKQQSLSDEDLRKLKECGISWRNKGFFAFAIWKSQMLAHFVLPETMKVSQITGVEYDDLTYIIVGNLVKECSEMKRRQILKEYMDEIIRLNDCMVGISRISDNLRGISALIEEAVSALAVGFYEGKIKAYLCEFQLEELPQLKEQWWLKFKRFFQEFYEKTGHEQYNVFAVALDYAKENRVPLVKYLTEFCCEVMDTIYIRYTAENEELTKQTLYRFKENVKKAYTFDEKRQYALDFASEYIWDKGVAKRHLSKSIADAVEFIQKNYNQPLTLEHIATEVNLNPAYLSRIFKEEMGCTYSCFLADIRIKRAAYLLLHTNEKVQDIGQEVGYLNVSYFSTTFKRHFGLNPYEYRRKKHNEIH